MMETADERREFFQDLEHLVASLTTANPTVKTRLPDFYISDSIFTPRYYGIKITNRSLVDIGKEGASVEFIALLDKFKEREFPFEKTLFNELAKTSGTPLTQRQREWIMKYGEIRSLAYSGLPNLRLSKYAKGFVPDHGVRFDEDSKWDERAEIPQIARIFYAKYFGQYTID